jgi:hypothetical protein
LDLNYFVSDSAIECYGDHRVVGDRLVRVLTMKEPPSHTFATVLRELYELPGDLTACLDWQRIQADRMRRDLQSRRRHFFNKRVSLVNYIAPDTKPEEMLTDDSATHLGGFALDRRAVCPSSRRCRVANSAQL